MFFLSVLKHGIKNSTLKIGEYTFKGGSNSSGNVFLIAQYLEISKYI